LKYLKFIGVEKSFLEAVSTKVGAKEKEKEKGTETGDNLEIAKYIR